MSVCWSDYQPDGTYIEGCMWPVSWFDSWPIWIHIAFLSTVTTIFVIQAFVWFKNRATN